MTLQFKGRAQIDPESDLPFGGKARGLARLLAAGATVPPGFALSATHDPPSAWTEGERLELRRRAAALCQSGPVAVRSSAMDEDAADRSFAGIFETVLDLADPDAVLAAADRCIASGRSVRVRAYAAAMAGPAAGTGAGDSSSTGSGPTAGAGSGGGSSAGTESAVAGRDAAGPSAEDRGNPGPPGVPPAPGLAVGLVVQRLVRARAAGVCFTRDPAGKDRAVLIEAVQGLGDRLVSGQARPDRWRVYRSGLGGWEIRGDAAPGRRGVASAPTRGPSPAPAGSPAAVLASAELEAIAEQATALEARFGHPLDLEWAIDAGGRLWWLQARPITAAVPVLEPEIERTAPGVDDGPITVWASWNVRETLPDPLPPLTWTLWRDIVLPFVTEQLMGVSRRSTLMKHVLGLDLVNGRLYFNMNAALSTPLMEATIRSMLHIVDTRAAAALLPMLKTGALQPRRLPGSRLGLTLNLLAASLSGARRMFSGIMPARALRKLRRGAEAIAARPDLRRLSDEALLQELELLTLPASDPFRDGISMMLPAMATFGIATWLFRDHPEAQGLLATGLQTPTTAISVGIDALAEQARPIAPLFLAGGTTDALFARLEADPQGSLWLADFRRFLEANGQRCPREFDHSAPRWIEDPTLLVDLIRTRLETPGQERLTDRMAQLSAARRQAIDAAAAASPLWRRPLMRLSARLVELYMPLREAPKHYAMFIWLRTRRAVLELASRLVDRGHLREKEEVFFLELEELRQAVAGSIPQEGFDARIGARRARHARFLVEKAPEFLRSDGVPVPEAEEEAGFDDGALRGTGVTGGKVVGTVRVLREPDARSLSPGDVWRWSSRTRAGRPCSTGSRRW